MIGVLAPPEASSSTSAGVNPASVVEERLRCGKRSCLALLALFATLSVAPADAQPVEELFARMDARAEHYGRIAQRIWERAEVGYREHESAAALRDELRAAGFEIDEGVAGMPTAFVATWGRGRPLIGILGAYDALPGLSQEVTAEKKPRVEGGAGHGCGHNLLGAASALAALSVRDGLLARQAPGTVRFYGTPAEAGGAAKVFMLRAGLFTDLDAALTWHPADRNQASSASSPAAIEARIRFRGQAAHVAQPPEAGRSPRDAALLTTRAIDELKGQVPQEGRLLCVLSAGVDPDVAELHVVVRHPELAALDDLWERVLACARASGLAAGALMEEQIVSSDANLLPNEALARLLDKNLRLAGGIRYSAEERAFAAALRRTFSTESALPLGSQESIQPVETGQVAASSEVGDVSWVVPTGQLRTATDVPGTPRRSWQSTACAGSSIGRKGMLLAAKALTLAALDLLTDPEQVKAARTDFEARKAGLEYRSRLPADARPPLDDGEKTPPEP